MTDQSDESRKPMTREEWLLELDSALSDVDYHLTRACRNLIDARHYADKVAK